MASQNFKDKLIALVEKKPVLYDMHDQHYRNNILKSAIWGRIAKKLNSDPKKCQQTWKNIKTQYFCDLKSNNLDKKKKRSFSKDVSFLENSKIYIKRTKVEEKYAEFLDSDDEKEDCSPKVESNNDDDFGNCIWESNNSEEKPATTAQDLDEIDQNQHSLFADDDVLEREEIVYSSQSNLDEVSSKDILLQVHELLSDIKTEMRPPDGINGFLLSFVRPMRKIKSVAERERVKMEICKVFSTAKYD